ncbi:hypothetical protein CTA1_12952 [Colletotrichum tanaceti]|uniref:Uncharacterized protein n=1 Tax=Colletotrichum tanaceti TaxID=1306861 RepID=A0A4U6X165_9PEZI|nr:hypothetical protein CTA1_12952 [Colletotrichum tanaceti]
MTGNQSSNKTSQQSGRTHCGRGVRCVGDGRGRPGLGGTGGLCGSGRRAGGRRGVSAVADDLIGDSDAGTGADILGEPDGVLLFGGRAGTGEAAGDAVEEAGVGADALDVEIAAAGDGIA